MSEARSGIPPRLDRRSSEPVVDLQTDEPSPDHAVVLYEEDAAGNVLVSETAETESSPRPPIRMDARDALFALHDIAVWRR